MGDQTLEDRGPTVFVVTLILIILATVFVILRLISKWGVTRKANADDYCTIVAWLFALGLAVSIMIGTTVGLGAPDSQIQPQWVEPLKRSIYAFTVMYNPALMTTKSAILILYYRVGEAHPFFRYASLCTLIIVDIAGIVLTFLNIFQCQPIYAAFSRASGTCIDIVALYLSQAPVNILTDLAILLLPLPILTSLRMEFRQKVVLVTTFIAGGFVTVIDVVRIVYLQTALKEERRIDSSATITASSPPPNFTYFASYSLMWSSVEVSIGIMCCCVLMLKPLVMRIMPTLLREKQQPTVATVDPLFGSDLSKHARAIDNIPAVEVPGSPVFSVLPLDHRGSVSCPPVSLSGILPEMEAPPSLTQAILTCVPEAEDDDACPGGEIDFFQMITSDPSVPAAVCHPLPQQPLEEKHSRRASWRSTLYPYRSEKWPSKPAQQPPQNFLDFVQLKSKVPLTQLTAKEAWWPIMFVSSLFFLWGFADGLIDTLNTQIQSLLGYSDSQRIALQGAYWAAYFIGPVFVGYWILTRVGFKATFITGLTLFAVGAMSFWPSSVLRSYPGFVISNVIIALGLSCLENAANPFIAIAGPGEWSETRLNFAQGVQGIGVITSALLAQQALFTGIGQQDLFRLQWCYLAVAFFVVFLAVVFYYVPLSEASNDDLEELASRRLFNAGLDKRAKTWGWPARRLVLWSGVLAILCYYGAQESIYYFWVPLVNDLKPGSDPFWILVIGRGVFTFSRFLGAVLMFWGVPPRIVSFVYAVGAFVTAILTMLLSPGAAALSMLLLTLFFEAPLFPTIFAMGLRNQGRHTKFAATALTAGICGAGWWPSIVWAVDKSHPRDSRYALRITIMLFGVLMLWPLLLSSTRVLRRWVDPRWSKPGLFGEGENGAPDPLSHRVWTRRGAVS